MSGVARFCCFIPPENQDKVRLDVTKAEIRALACPNRATWELWTGMTPDDYIDSCDAHVGALLGDQPLLSIGAIAG